MRTFVLSPVLLLLAAALPLPAQISISLQPRKPDPAVVGLPFSADQTVSTVQHLGNGMVVTRSLTGHVFRSSDGLERYDGAVTATGAAQPGPTLIYLLDRVHHTGTILNTVRQTAAVERFPADAAVAVRLLPAQRLAGVVSRTPAPQNLTTTDLGHRKFGLLDAVGRRVSSAIPAGRLGNDQPLPVTTEFWVVPSLKLVVSETTHDPFTGDRTYQLANIRADEPDPALFTIPDAYTVQEQHLPALPAPGLASAPALDKRTPQIEEALSSSDPLLKNRVAYGLSNNNDHIGDAETLAAQAVAIAEQQTASSITNGTRPNAFASMSALASFWDTLAWIYLREGKKQQAEAFERAAFDLKPNPEFCYHLGIIYETEGRRQDAIAIYQMALSKKNAPAALDFFQTHLARLGAPDAQPLPVEITLELAALPGSPAADTDTLVDITLARDEPPAITYLSGSKTTDLTQAIQSALANALPDRGPELLLRRARVLCTSGAAAPACALHFLSSDDLKPPPPPAN